MLHDRPHRRTHAFTLLELLSVMAILLILSGLAFGMVRGTKQRASLAKAKTELSHLAQALEEYKRHYGDYPQTSASLANSQKVTGTAGPGQTTAQARLFNALIGVYAPSNFSTRVNGPLLVDVSKLTVEVPAQLTSTTFAVANGSPPAKQALGNAFLDPWGNRYMYFYKVAGAQAGPRPVWTAASYVLYSTGPRGGFATSTGTLGVNPTSGAVLATSNANDTNSDYIFADKLP
jgi:prepilin-type N-terminal cleavage/methylation domain-containing protein